MFKEPPYFTAEPERRILVDVEETVDIVCRAMGECGEAAPHAAVTWRGIFQGGILIVMGTHIDSDVNHRASGT